MCSLYKISDVNHVSSLFFAYISSVYNEVREVVVWVVDMHCHCGKNNFFPGLLDSLKSS